MFRIVYKWGDCGRMWLKVERGGRIMFMSEYSHSIDSKGRMILPANSRADDCMHNKGYEREKENEKICWNYCSNCTGI